MRRFDSFEWLLICLILASFITGFFVAPERSEDINAREVKYPIVALCC
ncbi:hypothetical protein [Pedobacter psychrodurus]|nr:hypothetical protein [Pedobacter psychrodurus]